MEIIKKQIGNAEFEFIINSRDNRSGFVHECELFLNGSRIAQEKAQYYNRTWEAYRFQSVMLGCVRDALSAAEAHIKRQEMERRGWQKMTQKRREEVDPLIEQNSGVKVLKSLEDSVKGARYGTEQERQDLETLDLMLAVLEVLFERDDNEPKAA